VVEKLVDKESGVAVQTITAFEQEWDQGVKRLWL
jgi:hypothetical protein